jgi:hypothetical protein
MRLLHPPKQRIHNDSIFHYANEIKSAFDSLKRSISAISDAYKLSRHQIKNSPLEAGDGTQEKSGKKRVLSERSETERVKPRPDFSKRLSESEGQLPGVHFFGYFLSGTQRK